MRYLSLSAFAFWNDTLHLSEELFMVHLGILKVFKYIYVDDQFSSVDEKERKKA